MRPRSKSKWRLIFFIPGNPGLIAYYHPFLSLLARDLDLSSSSAGERDATTATASVSVLVGLSLGGFEVDVTQGNGAEGGRAKGAGKGGETARGDRIENEVEDRGLVRGEEREDRDEEGILFTAPFCGGSNGRKLFTLQDQIELSFARVGMLVDRIERERESRLRNDLVEEGGQQGDDDDDDSESIEVILMGHSVGAYICLELVRLWHERLRPEKSKTKPKWNPSTCILLTPTIQDIHLSPSGLMATPLLTSLSFLPALAQILVRSVLLRCLPAAWFAMLVSRATGMVHGSHGLEATLAFLKSTRGVEQALYMARWEMKEIGKDRWGNEIWGVSQDKTDLRADGEKLFPSPSLIFWFSKEDHWVAEATKQAIIQHRASGIPIRRDKISKLPGTVAVDVSEKAQVEIGGPKIQIQETDGLVHAWCLLQSDVVAKRVGMWLSEATKESL